MASGKNITKEVLIQRRKITYFAHKGMGVE